MIKEHILDIATSEFAILGYSALSMNNLAKKLEINKATIYYPNKSIVQFLLFTCKKISIFSE